MVNREQSTAQYQQNQEAEVDFREKEAKTTAPVCIGGATVEHVNSFEFLNITENLS